MNPLLTPRQVATVLNVRIRQVYLLIKKRQIKAAKIGRQIRINQDDLALYLRLQGSK